MNFRYCRPRCFYNSIILGGEGKLATPAHKCVVLAAIGNVSFNCSRHTEESLTKLIQQFNDYLASETHDATLQYAFQQLNLWFSKSLASSTVTADLVKTLNNFFKVSVELNVFQG